ncbi:unnamed protein product [Cladocopium goreaui]|uniref:Uncharacterized protein n=1 Tax=Cladocopium goreaui TaxID=2562237 RepID=A0A9P1GAY1_9DINO|nr:unnamed protein product [Cladocopium goreaui]
MVNLLMGKVWYGDFDILQFRASGPEIEICRNHHISGQRCLWRASCEMIKDVPSNAVTSMPKLGTSRRRRTPKDNEVVLNHFFSEDLLCAVKNLTRAVLAPHQCQAQQDRRQFRNAETASPGYDLAARRWKSCPSEVLSSTSAGICMLLCRTTKWS